MERYEIRINSSAVKEIEGIDSKRERVRAVNRIRELAIEPRPAGCEKLSMLERYRVRQESYRIVYSVEDDEQAVHVVKFGHRRDVYRRR